MQQGLAPVTFRVGDCACWFPKKPPPIGAPSVRRKPPPSQPRGQRRKGSPPRLPLSNSIPSPGQEQWRFMRCSISQQPEHFTSPAPLLPQSALRAEAQNSRCQSPRCILLQGLCEAVLPPPLPGLRGAVQPQDRAPAECAGGQKCRYEFLHHPGSYFSDAYPIADQGQQRGKKGRPLPH